MIFMYGSGKMVRSVFVPCFYLKDLYGRELKRFLVIIFKVVIFFLMVFRGIIFFEEYIVAVGIISNNKFLKRKVLDEGLL